MCVRERKKETLNRCLDSLLNIIKKECVWEGVRESHANRISVWFTFVVNKERIVYERGWETANKVFVCFTFVVKNVLWVCVWEWVTKFGEISPLWH